MLTCENYRMFRGTMKITPKNPDFEPFTMTGDWLYKPDTQCWYCHCRSFPEAVCTVVEDMPEGIG